MASINYSPPHFRFYSASIISDSDADFTERLGSSVCNALWDTWLRSGRAGRVLIKGAGPKCTNVGPASAAEDEQLEFASVSHLLPGRLQPQISAVFTVQPDLEELDLS